MITIPKSKYIYLTFLFILIVNLQAEIKVAGTLEEDTEWTIDESPYIIIDDLIIPAEIALSIEPGVEILCREKVSIIVKGDLFAAGEEDDEILFRNEKEDKLWGGIRFLDFGSSYGTFVDIDKGEESNDIRKFKGKPKSYNEDLDYVSGSVLSYCTIEGVGTSKRPKKEKGSNHSGAVFCYNTSPYIEYCTIRNNHFDKGGAVACTYYSSPIIKNCLIHDNYSTFGGAGIYCFFFSTPVITDNIILNNSAKDDGGGILINSSTPLIQNNIFFQNSTDGRGGGGAILASEPILRNNLFRDNKSVRYGTDLYISGSEMILQENSFINTLLDKNNVEINIGSGDSSVIATANYMNSTIMENINERIFDKNDNPLLAELKIKDISNFPSGNLLNSPNNLHDLVLKYDKNFQTDLNVDLSHDFPMYIQIEADGGLPFYKDMLTVWIRSSKSDTEGIHVKLYETGLVSGIYRGEAIVKHESDEKNNYIEATIGETITISADLNEEESYSFVVQEKIPYITSTNLSEEKNAQRVVSHTPLLQWQYYDLRGKPQKSYQLQFGTDNDWKTAEIYDTGERKGIVKTFQLPARGLEDGEKYYYRIRVFNGSRWSGYLEGNFQMNQTAAAPLPQSPAAGIINKTKTASFSIKDIKDPDGDQLTYLYELSGNEDFSNIVEISDSLTAANWQNKVDFQDNKTYYWRVKVFDGYEDSKYSKPSLFYANYIEENPSTPLLTYPSNNSKINTTIPSFSWQKCFDPDPKASIEYSVVYSTDGSFKSNLKKIENLSNTEVVFEKEELKHNVNYFWKVTATDNSGRKSSSKVAAFTVDTKPSVPKLLAEKKEFFPNDNLSWQESTDPQAGDILTYSLQISKTPDYKTVFIIQNGISGNNINFNKLTNNKSLKDDKKYYARLKATDNHNVSSTFSKGREFIFNRTNNKPQPVSKGFNIKNDQVLTTTAPQFRFDHTTDRDFSDTAENLSYEIILSENKKFSNGNLNFKSLAGENLINTSNIKDDSRWFYKIRAIDDQGALSEWSKTNTFIVNEKEDSPDSFDLTTPKNDFITYKMSGINFNWQKSSDQDYGSTITYSFLFGKEKDLSDKKAYRKLKTNSFKLNEKLENETTYYWQILAVDNNGNETKSSSIFNFTVNSTPSVPKLYAAAKGKERTIVDNLSWIKAKDPDPSDLISYTILISDNESFNKTIIKRTKISSKENIISRSFRKLDSAKKLKDNTVYFWKIRAVDSKGNSSAYSQQDSFFFNKTNNAPELISDKISPIDKNIWKEGTKVTFSWGVSDPDMSDTEKNIKARLMINDKENFRAPLFDYAIDAGRTSFSKKLTDNKTYYWKIRVIDNDNKKSNWSKIRSFVLNTKEEKPLAFNLHTPANKKTTYKLKPKFKWEKSGDRDPSSTLKYRFELAEDKEFKNIIATEVTNTTGITLKESLDNNSTFFWRVTAIDNTGLETRSKKIFEINIDSTPSVVNFLNKNGQEIMHNDGAFSWNKSKDPNPKDKISYQLEISDSENFDNIILSLKDYNFVKKSISKISGIAKISENKLYYARVRATDNNGFQSDYSKPLSFVYNIKNDPPLIDKQQLSPVDNTIIKDKKAITFTFSAKDPDYNDKAETIRYILQIDDTEFKNKKISYELTIKAGQNKITRNLADNKKWSWRIKAIDDGNMSSKWSTVRTLIVNTKEDAPAKFKLSTPKSGIETYKFKPTFQWESSSDEDPGAIIKYRFELSAAADFVNPLVKEICESNSYTLKKELTNQKKYYWKVTALDNTGLETACSKIYDFTVNSSPSSPVFSNKNDEVLNLDGGKLSWSKSKDPDPEDKVTYNLEISADEKFSSLILSLKDYNSTTRFISKLKKVTLIDNKAYFARVSATDNKGCTSDYSSILKFNFNSKNDAPAATEIITPNDGEKVKTTKPEIKWKKITDPDFNDDNSNIRSIIQFNKTKKFDDKKIRYQYKVPKGVNKFKLPQPLSDNRKWYFRVRSIDQHGKSNKWTEVREILINTKEDAPSVFKLTSPRSYVKKPETLTFNWTEAKDPDYQSSISYDLYYSSDSKFKSRDSKKITGIKSLSYKPAEILKPGIYYWKVRAIDNTGKKTWCKGYEKFEIKEKKR